MAIYDPTCDLRPGEGIKTSIGCIPAQLSVFIPWLISKILPIVATVSFFIMIYGFILLAISEGDPKKILAAKDTIVSAISGLVLAIFGIFIMKLIAIDILQIPGISR